MFSILFIAVSQIWDKAMLSNLDLFANKRNENKFTLFYAQKLKTPTFRSESVSGILKICSSRKRPTLSADFHDLINFTFRDLALTTSEHHPLVQSN